MTPLRLLCLSNPEVLWLSAYGMQCWPLRSTP